MLTSATWHLHRLEARPFIEWSWVPHPTPRFRFDSTSGARRVRYATTAAHGVARERYYDVGRMVPADHGDHQWTELDGHLSLLDLADDAALTALGLDAGICTGYEPDVTAACHQLTDAVHDWWGYAVDGFSYTSRTTPAASINVAFFDQAPLVGHSATLASRADLHGELVVTGGLTLGFL